MVTLLELQNKQLIHDQKCHRDILYMSHQERFKHMVMHYGKYSGRLADLLRTHSDHVKTMNEVKRTLIDCFIIVLSSAEVLQMNLEDNLKNKLGIVRDVSINELSDILKESASNLFSLLNSVDERERVLNLMLELTSIGGFMQKVGEDLDHLVGIPRDQIKEQTSNMLVILLLAGIVWSVDYENDVPARWDAIGKKTVIQGPQ